MATNQWAILNLQYKHTSTGVIITATTDYPCHLWCRMTTTPPKKHIDPITRRGAAIGSTPRFCVDVYEDNEQEEEGDTLTHTFIKDPWEMCETRWFYFYATILTDWEFLEPWGTTLTEYNYWYKYREPKVPSVSFDQSIMTITNPGHEDCGISGPPIVDIPLVQPDTGEPLLLGFNNPEATENSTSSQVLIEMILRHPAELFAMYLAIGLGAAFEYLKPQWTGYVAGRGFGVQFVGTGEYTIDLKALFIKFRTELGLSIDPAGWSLNLVAFALGTSIPSCVDYLKSDYIAAGYRSAQPIPSPSETPIFEYHKDFTFNFYPDKHPEKTSVDGWASTTMTQGTWAEKHDELGSSANDWGDSIAVGFGTWAGVIPGWWLWILRSFMLFDSSPIVDKYYILEATLFIKGREKRDENNAKPDINLCSSWPYWDTAIQPLDYHRLGVIPFCDTPISYDDFKAPGWNSFKLNPAGLAAINKAGITKFALRNWNYDRANIEPPGYWKPTSSYSGFRIWSAERGKFNGPRLLVRCRPLKKDLKGV